MFDIRLLLGFLCIKLILFSFSLSFFLFFFESHLFSFSLLSGFLICLYCKCFGSDLFFSEFNFSLLLSPVFLDLLFQSIADLFHRLITETSLMDSRKWINIFKQCCITSMLSSLIGAVNGPRTSGNRNN